MNNINIQEPICIEKKDDEIDFKEIFLIIWRYKFFILFVVVIGIILSTIKALSKPNQYKIYTVLAPDQYQVLAFVTPQTLNVEGNKVNIEQEIKITPDVYFTNLLHNYIFMKKFITKRKIAEKLLESNKKDYQFTSSYYKLINFLPFLKKKNNNKKLDVYSLYKLLAGIIKISTNKKKDNGIITMSVIHPSRYFAYYILTSFLKDGSEFLINKSLQDINLQIKNYQEELKRTGNIEIKADLIKLISSLIKQKVYIYSTKYYKVKVLSEPYIPDVRDKVKPKRGLMIIIGTIASFFVGVFLSLLINFLFKLKKDKSKT